MLFLSVEENEWVGDPTLLSPKKSGQVTKEPQGESTACYAHTSATFALKDSSKSAEVWTFPWWGSLLHIKESPLAQ